MCKVLSPLDKDKQCEPLHIWSNHSLPITGLHVGKSGPKARVATCSLDQTCKLYSIASGDLLLSVALSTTLTSITLDPADLTLFIGSQKGQIFTIDFTKPPNNIEHHVSEDEKKEGLFQGHSKTITCLDVSTNGLTLVSG